MDIKGIINKYYEQFYGDKLDRLGGMDKFLEKHNVWKHTQEETDHLNRSIFIKEIELITNNFPPAPQKKPGPDDFTGQFYQIFKEEIIPILYNLFQKILPENVFQKLPNSFYKANIILIPKPDKSITRKENYRLTSLINIGAKFFKKINKPNPIMY